MSSHNDEVWKKICQVFLETKQLTLQMEEISDDHKVFLQPINEMKSALDHLLRVRSVELGITGKKESEAYILSNLNKTLGHMYRAFFDTADQYSILLREKILNRLQRYSSEVIHKGIKDYYSEKRAFIDKLNLEIANLRSLKDIGNDDTVLPSIDNYKEKLDRLYRIYQEIDSSVPQLNALQKAEDREKKGRQRLAVAGIVFGIIGLVGTIFTILSFILGF